MASENSPDWLPSGWIVQAKDNGKREVKYYCNVETGQRFSSKEDVIRYVKMGCLSIPQPMSEHNISAKETNNMPIVVKRNETPQPMSKHKKSRKKTNHIPIVVTTNETPQPMRKHKKSSKKTNHTPIVVKGNETPDWLPHGWIMELKTVESGAQIGMKYKCYIDPESGRKLYSKQQVSHYLETGNSSRARQKRHNVDGSTGGKSSSETDVPLRNEISEWLPSGWIVEVKTRESGKCTGMKYKLYTDPESGRNFFSKKQVSHYLATLNSRTARQKRDNVDCLTGDKSSLEPDLAQDCKTTNNKRGRPKKKNIGEDNVDCLTGDKSSSEPDVSQGCKITNNKRDRSKRKNVGKVIERGSADGLPPGWTKETRPRKYRSGVTTDTFYTDPLSGYRFRSKPDALRYLKTGDIKECKIKPTKIDINDMESINEDIPSLCAVNGQEVMHGTTRRQLFAGKESCDTSSLAASEAESSKETQDNNISPDAVVAASIPTSDNPIEKHPHDSVNEKFSKTEGSSDPETNASGFAENGCVSTPATDILQDKVRLTENGMVKCSNQKKKTSLAMPGRSSKRLKGLEPEIKGDSWLNERGIRAAARGGTEQFEAELESETNKSEKPLEDPAVQEEQPGGENAGKQNDEKTELEESQFLYPLGDSAWPDPCLEFAVKTLTGAIPVEDNLVIQGLFQRSDPSQTQSNVPSKSASVQQGNVNLPSGKCGAKVNRQSG